MLTENRSMALLLQSLRASGDADFRGRRASDRRAVNVQVSFDSGGKREGWALNLSAGGIRILTDHELSMGETLHLRIEGGEDSTGLWAVGQVAWVVRHSDGFVAGISFSKPH